MRALQTYKDQSLHGASNAEILVLLFEKAVSRLTQARTHMERGERLLWLGELARTRAIIVELMLSLDHQAAPELTRNLHLTYSWALNRVGEVGKTGDIEATNQVIRVCETLLGAFREAVCSAPAEDSDHDGAADEMAG